MTQRDGISKLGKPPLTVKQAKLIKGIAQGKPKQVAALEAGYGNNLNSAAAIANETLKNPNVQEALQAELSRQGITLETIVAPVTRALADDSIELQLKGHDRAVKLLGLKQGGDGSSDVHYHLHQAQQRDKYGL